MAVTRQRPRRFGANPRTSSSTSASCSAHSVKYHSRGTLSLMTLASAAKRRQGAGGCGQALRRGTCSWRCDVIEMTHYCRHHGWEFESGDGALRGSGTTLHESVDAAERAVRVHLSALRGYDVPRNSACLEMRHATGDAAVTSNPAIRWQYAGPPLAGSRIASADFVEHGWASSHRRAAIRTI
jgi:hypothetical protein